jgi:hypothetical protein
MSTPGLDLVGPAAPPRSNGELAFDHPWQRRLFATTMALCDAGVITYDQFRERLIAAIERSPGPYWLSWQDALENLVDEHQLCGSDELTARAAAFSAHSTG